MRRKSNVKSPDTRKPFIKSILFTVASIQIIIVMKTNKTIIQESCFVNKILEKIKEPINPDKQPESILKNKHIQDKKSFVNGEFLSTIFFIIRLPV